MILVMPKWQVKQKTRGFAAWKVLALIFKLERATGVWTNIRILASGFFVHMQHFDIHFYCFFFQFFWFDLFLKGFFPIPS